MNYDQLTPGIDSLSVKNLDGEDVALESLWKDRKVVLAFLRHFG